MSRLATFIVKVSENYPFLVFSVFLKQNDIPNDPITFNENNPCSGGIQHTQTV